MVMIEACDYSASISQTTFEALRSVSNVGGEGGGAVGDLAGLADPRLDESR
jgi:hypothetical protein